MFRLFLIAGGSLFVLGSATATHALPASPLDLKGSASIAITVADDMEEEAVEQALEPQEVTEPSDEDESSGSMPSEETEIEDEENKE